MEQSNLVKLLSNYGARIWSLVSVFIFIPLYIKFFGGENYGLIGFYALLLGIISFADAGMSSAIIREFSSDASASYKYSVLRTLERVYITVCLVICTIIFFLAPIIVEFWISAEEISKSDLIYFTRLIGLGISTQLLTSLYFGALFASNRQVKSNILQFIWSFSRSALVIILVILFSKTIEIYFIWQILCNCFYLFVLRFCTIKELRQTDPNLLIEFSSLPSNLLKYIGGMIIISIISAVNIQADKLVTSVTFDLKTFGFYTIASNLSQIPLIATTPLVAFVFPLFSKFSSNDAAAGVEKNLIVFRKIFFLVCLIGSAMSITILLYAEQILLLWTRSTIPAELLPAIIFTVKLLVTGTFFLSLQLPLYYYLLSRGKTKYTIYQGVLQILIGLPILYFSVNKYGLYGVSIPWLFLNLGSFIYLIIVVSRGYMMFLDRRFIKTFFLEPILINVIVGILIYFLYQQCGTSFLPFAIISPILTVLLCVVYFNVISKVHVLNYKHFLEFPHE